MDPCGGGLSRRGRRSLGRVRAARAPRAHRARSRRSRRSHRRVRRSAARSSERRARDRAARGCPARRSRAHRRAQRRERHRGGDDCRGLDPRGRGLALSLPRRRGDERLPPAHGPRSHADVRAALAREDPAAATSGDAVVPPALSEAAHRAHGRAHRPDLGPDHGQDRRAHRARGRHLARGVGSLCPREPPARESVSRRRMAQHPICVARSRMSRVCKVLPGRGDTSLGCAGPNSSGRSM